MLSHERERRKPMKTIRGQMKRTRWHPGRAAIAGLAATAAYNLVMEADMALTGNRYSDVRFIQGLLEMAFPRRKPWPLLCWSLHFLNGVFLAESYALVFKRFLPGPTWLKGTLFGELFLASAWGVAPLVDRYHPLTRRGELARLATWTSFWQNIVRHAVFGLVLGWLYGDEHASLEKRSTIEPVSKRSNGWNERNGDGDGDA
jgi:hypothetical protein